MKKNIHPKYFKEAKVTCACGQIFTVGSTLENIAVEICSACHPFYTGKQKLVDSARRVDKFKKRVEVAQKVGKKTLTKKAKKTKQKAKQAAKKVKIEVEK
ncbi:MAG: 50S ribosomal protein L31 [Candidatus Buchananbacteria bacterium RIFCSPHIGHO2_02_FULL_40_13]|uniref:Large ribosomal subunit protein bL31 n=1 Tax=Candidatus Buchananbacteria bacterium RIFCSPLOWO2_01_FULL_39_33 TaxID=1797543 RepID=A0A1G1YJU4_9BACT|nr:MAG: 50S ribosomal protein L31 [Candidatus Buchananbacteria bacterium RIFCSPHIGHO2_01_FULL_40_35]OGY50693.1 MAG: 50S ribosomal protein L31 [Candidatus Buchananbacteria bacterium RIFCSPHIGHO2_02_FULL_40_13]OGY52622.1 MAG: 50S ribosomal protein L31 [Candidatus Buchananbacteria bacterium RIFCSPLOWO2_01_FULL_39_33]